MNIKRVSFIFFLALTLIYGGYNLGRSIFGPKQGEDFAQYYVASRLILDGESLTIYDAGVIYQDKAKDYGVQGVLVHENIQKVMTYAYPPFVAFFMIPFSIFPYNYARYFFFAISIFAIFFSIPLLFSNRSKDSRKELILVGWLATFIFFPNYYSLYMGQINAILFFFCVLTLFFIRKRHLYLAGLFLALASLIKIFPLVLIPFFILKKQYKIIGITVVFIFILFGLSIIVCDVKLYTIFFKEILPMQFSGGAWVRNQGFVGFFTRLFTQNEYVESIGHYPNVAQFLALLSSAIVICSAILCTRRSPDYGTFRYEIEYGLYFVVALLILAKSWEHYGMFLLFSYFYLFEFLVYKHCKGQVLLFFISVSFCIWTFILATGIEYEQIPKNILMNFIISSKFVATFILLVCNIWILHKKQDNTLLAQIGTQS